MKSKVVVEVRRPYTERLYQAYYAIVIPDTRRVIIPEYSKSSAVI
jgi:hypothetical protein